MKQLINNIPVVIDPQMRQLMCRQPQCSPSHSYTSPHSLSVSAAQGPGVWQGWLLLYNSRIDIRCLAIQVSYYLPNLILFLYICIYFHISVCLSVCISIYQSINQSIYLSVYTCASVPRPAPSCQLHLDAPGLTSRATGRTLRSG